MSSSHANIDNTPPQSIEAERAVLGGLLIDPQAWERIAGNISEGDFYRHDHRLIFRTIQKLVNNNQPVDVVTLSEFLAHAGQLGEAGGTAYLIELAKNTPSASNINAYAEIVHERAILRDLITVGNEIALSAYQPAGRIAAELLDEAERKVFSIAERGMQEGGPQSIKTILARTVDRIDELFHSDSSLTGLSTGYIDLDRMTAGLQAGDLIIVAGRPSMGKTTFAMNIAEHAAMKQDKPVLVFSLEMPAESLVLRLLSSLGRVEQTRLRNGKLNDDDWPRFTSAVALLSERGNLFIDDSSGISPTELRARARRLQREHGSIGLIVVDYLQLMQVPGFRENRTAEISEISRALKLLAKELGAPIIALSQLNRSLENRPTNKRPIMSDLRECVTGDTLVYLSSGERVPIKELVGQQPEVLTMNEVGKMINAPCEIVWKVGTKPVYQVHLASGRSIKATQEHRLYGANGWKTIANLKIGDRLAIANKIPEPQSKSLLMECEKELFWDHVTAVIPLGEEEVYDLTVPVFENWLADGIVTHNSGAIEQDADVIAFVYRDEVYHKDSQDKGVAEIIIGKQRNGPIGTVRLAFQGEFSRFDNLASDSYNDYT